MSQYFSYTTKRVRTWPVVLPEKYIQKYYVREFHWWGRIINDIQWLIINKILG